MSAPAVAEIRTERLILRPIALEDLDAYAAIYADPDVVRFLSDGETATGDETREWIEGSIRRNELDGWDRRSVLLGSDGTVIGRCGLSIWEIEGHTEHEIGWVLDRERWGCGYATEAAIAMRDRAFGELGLTRLISLIDGGNDASKNVARKLGLGYERQVEFHGRTVELFALEA